MDFNDKVNAEDLCTRLENSIKEGNEAKAAQLFLQILENKIYLQIDLEEIPKKIEKIEPNKVKNPVFEGFCIK